MQYIFTAFYKHTDRDFCPLQVKKSRGQTILSVPGLQNPLFESAVKYILFFQNTS